MKICSLVPSGTEILYALGLGDEIVGISHECDHTPDALTKPRILRTIINQDHLSSEEIDGAVRASIKHQQSLYRVDLDALQRAQPDLILTQELCDVCAVDTAQVSEVLRVLPYKPRVISLHPHTLSEALENIRLVAEATGRQAQAEQLLALFRERIHRVQERLAGLSHRPRVFCVEWLEPPMACGHWVPEMVERAGGMEVLGQAGEPSRYVTPEEIVAAQPDVLVLMPCGFPIERTRKELSALMDQSWWHHVPAVGDGRVYLVNGPAYCNRSGPRLIDGIELLAKLLHPDRCAALLPSSESLEARL